MLSVATVVPASSVLVNRAAGQRDVGRILVDQVVDREGDDFRIGVATSIGRLDRDVMALIGLEVDGCAGRDTDLVTDNLEEARGIIGDRIGVAVAGIGIDRAQSGNSCSGSGVLVDRSAGQRDIGRVLIDQVVDREGDDFRIGVATGIGGLDRDVMGLIGLEVDRGAAATRTSLPTISKKPEGSLVIA